VCYGTISTLAEFASIHAVSPTIDDEKQDPRRSEWVKYRLARAIVYQAPSGHCFTDQLDDVSELSPEVDAAALTDAGRRYIGEVLSSNRARVERQVALVRTRLPAAARVLDVGCGGGLFLARLREQAGAAVEGTELNDARVLYAREVHGVSVHKRLLEDPFFARDRSAHYDVVTLWDALEHVNFPAQTLCSAAQLLKPGGHLLLETPCRDGWMHRIGDATYRWSRGRYPTLLNLMYSNHPFGHKQILGLLEVARLLEHAGLQPLELRLFHELALPYQSYLQKLLRSQRAARLLAPAARAFFDAAPLANKLLAIARK